MIVAGVVLFIIAAMIVSDHVFRRWVTPRIQSIFENVPPFNVAIEKRPADAECVSIVTADGVTLQGSLINGHLTDPLGLILFLPELRGNHWMAKRYCEALIRSGYVVLAFDFRNQGESDSMPGYSPIHWVTEYEMTDVAGMMDYIDSRPDLNSLPLLACGVSRGGVAALLAGCRFPQIRGVIADSAFGTMLMTKYFVDRFVSHVIPMWFYRLLPQWHVELTLRTAMQLSEKSRRCTYVHLERERDNIRSGSVLLISGERDSYVTPEIATRLKEIIRNRCQLWIAPGAKHNMSRSVCKEDYDRRILNHAAACLGLAPDTRTIDQESALASTAGGDYSMMQK